MSRTAPTIAAVICVALASQSWWGIGGFAAEPEPNFSREILPILSDNCFHCHGPDAKTREADLQLDTEAGALRTDSPVILPGKSGDSELIRRLISDDPDLKMPPPSSNRKLSPEQIDLLRRWIDSGAKWGKHWAYETPVRPAVPKVKHSAAVKNPIDAFILARLEREELKPSPAAPRETLIRRVTLDLTGLPPTPEEVAAFVADDSPQAYEKVVDRLLSSRRYGERMVWEWLDAARYADTNGYQGDPTRAMWYWRDQVTEALNNNQPFDQFTIEQLAGDLLPNPTQQQLIASGFHRNHMINGEGGRIAEESRVDYVQDRVETTGTVWMGLTFNCCRCHDHKFDPLKQQEYYSLAAYFNSIEESGGNDAGGLANPVLTFASPEQEEKLAALRKEEQAAKRAKDELEKKLPELQTAWEQSLVGSEQVAPLAWKPLLPKELKSSGGVELRAVADQAVLASGENADKAIYTIAFAAEPITLTALRLETLPHESFINQGPGRADNGNFVLSELKLTRAGKPVKLNSATADFSQDGWSAAGAIDGKSTSGWAVMPAFGKPHQLTLVLAKPLKLAADDQLELELSFDFGRQHTLGHFRLLGTSAPADQLKETPADIVAAAKQLAGERNDADKKKLFDYFRVNHAPWLAAEKLAEDKRKARDGFEKSLPRTMVMRERKEPRETFILTRGAYDKPETKVAHGVPAILPPLPENAPTNRLALARWLVSPEHPLTSRVVVNRHWQMFFGTGIVKTTEDFGVQSERPSHPELLDWLALEFQQPTVSQPSVAIADGENRWNVKHLHRLIVTSNTYQQSSKSSPALQEKDPANRLLARAPRFRWPSWMIRDQALAVSGLLVDKPGGPPVKGYQPSGVWEDATFGKITYQQDQGEALYRRSLYQFWRRIVGPTIFFDVANRQTCSVKAARTNTPLHALTTLNDVTYVEASRAWAGRLLKSDASSSPERLKLAYRQLLAREPSPAEEKIVLTAFETLRQKYAADPEGAKQLLAIGASPRDDKLDLTDHATWTALCNLLLNLDETLSKE
jgi:hypothetical protein